MEELNKKLRPLIKVNPIFDIVIDIETEEKNYTLKFDVAPFPWITRSTTDLFVLE